MKGIVSSGVCSFALVIGLCACAQLQSVYASGKNALLGTNDSQGSAQAGAAPSGSNQAQSTTDSSLNALPPSPLEFTAENLLRTSLTLSMSKNLQKIENVPTAVLLSCLMPNEYTAVSGNEFALRGDQAKAEAEARQIAKAWVTGTIYHVYMNMDFGEYDFDHKGFILQPANEPDAHGTWLRSFSGNGWLEPGAETACNPVGDKIVKGYPVWPSTAYNVELLNYRAITWLPIAPDKASHLIDIINSGPSRGARELPTEVILQITTINLSRLQACQKPGSYFICMDSNIIGYTVWNPDKSEVLYQAGGK